VFGKLFGSKKDSNSYIGKTKQRRSKESKKERWKRFPERLYNALESNVHANQIDLLKENLIEFSSMVDEKRKIRLLTLSLQNGSKECAEYFLEQGITCNPNFILLECKFNKIIDVYNLLSELLNKYPNSFIGNERKMPLNKITLIKRLIDPSKIEDNQKRVDYLLENMEFFGASNITEVIDEHYKGSSKMSRLKSLIREIKLKELGI